MKKMISGITLALGAVALASCGTKENKTTTAMNPTPDTSVPSGYERLDEEEGLKAYQPLYEGRYASSSEKLAECNLVEYSRCEYKDSEGNTLRNTECRGILDVSSGKFSSVFSGYKDDASYAINVYGTMDENLWYTAVFKAELKNYPYSTFDKSTGNYNDYNVNTTQSILMGGACYSYEESLAYGALGSDFFCWFIDDLTVSLEFYGNGEGNLFARAVREDGSVEAYTLYENGLSAETWYESTTSDGTIRTMFAAYSYSDEKVTELEMTGTEYGRSQNMNLTCFINLEGSSDFGYTAILNKAAGIYAAETKDADGNE